MGESVGAGAVVIVGDGVGAPFGKLVGVGKWVPVGAGVDDVSGSVALDLRGVADCFGLGETVLIGAGAGTPAAGGGGSCR